MFVRLEGDGDSLGDLQAPLNIGRRQSNRLMTGFKLVLLAACGSLPRNTYCGRGTARKVVAVIGHGVRLVLAASFAVLALSRSNSVWTWVISIPLILQFLLVGALGAQLDRLSDTELPLGVLFARDHGERGMFIPARTTIAQLVAESSASAVDALICTVAVVVMASSFYTSASVELALALVVPPLTLVVLAPVLVALLVVCGVARLGQEAVLRWLHIVVRQDRHASLEQEEAQAHDPWLQRSREAYVRLNGAFRLAMRAMERVTVVLGLLAIVGMFAHLAITYALAFRNIKLPLPRFLEQSATVTQDIVGNTVGVTVGYATVLVVVIAYLTRPFVATQDARLALGRKALLRVPLHDVQALQALLLADPCAVTLFGLIVDGSLVTKVAISAAASLAAPILRIAGDTS